MDRGPAQKQMHPGICPCPRDPGEQEQPPAAPQDLRGGGFEASGPSK